MSDQSVPASPLDPFLVRFLAQVSELKEGFQPGPETQAIAAHLELPGAFIEGLFTSARMRGLLKPAYGRGSKIHWTVSTTGVQMIQDQALSGSEDVPG